MLAVSGRSDGCSSHTMTDNSGSPIKHTDIGQSEMIDSSEYYYYLLLLFFDPR